MSLLSIKHLNKSFSHKVLFEDEEIIINENDKIGLIGKNGSGKTTLFNIITGTESFRGQIFKSDIRIGYFKQIETIPENILAIEFILDAKIGSERYGEFYPKIISLAKDLNLADELFYRNINTLSGGEKTKAFIIKVILDSPDLLILDEPTNHLDLAGIEYLKNWLNNYNGVYIIVSHDRSFLSFVTNKIVELENKKINTYCMSYARYITFKKKSLEDDLSEYHSNKKERARLLESANQKKQWSFNASKTSVSAQKQNKDKFRTPLYDRKNKTYNGSLAKSYKLLFERANAVDLSKPFEDTEHINIDFVKLDKSYNEVLKIKDLSYKVNDKLLFENVNLDISYRDKVFLLGNNGVGKTTLLNLIVGELNPDSGTIILGNKVKISYIGQEKIVYEGTVISFLSNKHKSIDVMELRHYLAKFLFRENDIDKPFSVLSGGELMRLELLDAILSGSNFLILDEPTNNLDLKSIEVLEIFLKDFPGTLLIVSHDKQLISSVGTQTYELNLFGLKTLNSKEF